MATQSTLKSSGHPQRDGRKTQQATFEQKVLKIVFSERAFLALRLALIGLCGKLIHSVYVRKEWLLPYIVYCWSLVKNNPFLMAIFGGSIIATPAAVIRYVVHPLWFYIKSFFVAKVTIESSDPSFVKVRDYIMELPHHGIAADSNLKAVTKKANQTWRDWKEEMSGVAMKKIPEITYASESGHAIHINYKNTQLSIYISKHGKPEVVGYDRQLMQPYEIEISAVGRDGIDVIKEFINDSLRNDLRLDTSDTTNIYVSCNSWLGNWQKAMEKKKRDKTTVVLDEDLSERLVKDARSFLSSSEWYAKRGIPYRRGYLLYGPPGTGKTSFCQVLASELDADLCLLTLTDSELTDTRLAESMREAPRGSIILLEDVDAVFVERQAANTKNGGNGVSFSGLLNAIDGVASQEGRIFVMTTNHIEKLDPALKRPGRCDVTAKLDLASRSQMVSLFTRFYARDDVPTHTTKAFSMKEYERNKGLERKRRNLKLDQRHKINAEKKLSTTFPNLLSLAKQFSRMLPERELSMAKLSGYLMKWKKPEDAIKVKNIQKLLHVSQEKQIVSNVSVYDHFRRVGLEHLTPYFEANNFLFCHDLVRINDIKTCKSWCWELDNDERSFSRLKRLLENDPKIMEEYERATIATIRDAFLAQFPENRMIETRFFGESLATDASSGDQQRATQRKRPFLRRLDSDELKEHTKNLILNSKNRHNTSISSQSLTQIVHHNDFADILRDETKSMEISKRLQSMAQDFVAAVCKNGKVEISLWQLRWLLSQFDNPDEMIVAAKTICSSRPLSSFKSERLNIRTWLKWAGLTKYIHHFEKKGGVTDYMDLKEKAKNGIENFLKKIRINCTDRNFLIKLIKNEKDDSSVTGGILRPYKSHVAKLFWSHYGSTLTDNENDTYKDLYEKEKHLIEAASYFSKTVCDNYGRSLVSFIELGQYFKNYDNFEDAVANYEDKLLRVKLPDEEKPPPPSPPPANWVYKMLRNIGGDMRHIVADSLEAAEIKTKEDLLAKPSLSLEEINKIGITKLGIAKKLYRLIFKLQQAEEQDIAIDRDDVRDEDSEGHYQNANIDREKQKRKTKMVNEISGIPSTDDCVITPLGKGRVKGFIESTDMYEIELDFGGIAYISDTKGNVSNYFMEYLRET